MTVCTADGKGMDPRSIYFMLFVHTFQGQKEGKRV